MGVKYGKDYEVIIEELSEAIGDIDGCHQFFEMSPDDWAGLDGGERRDCLRTMADDIFYGLGADPQLPLGSCRIVYDADNHIIKVVYDDHVTRMVRLV